ncbi:MAG TPA: DUF1127 domain-containing protein [Devosia sp.]
MTTLDIDDPGIADGKRRQRPFARVRTLFARMRVAALKRKAFQDISHLDAHLLRDIGVAWADVHDGIEGRRRTIWLEPLPREDGRFKP